MADNVPFRADINLEFLGPTLDADSSTITTGACTGRLFDETRENRVAVSVPDGWDTSTADVISTPGDNTQGRGDFYSNFSPDGETILFATERYTGDEQIVTMDLDGTNLVRLTNNAFREYTPAYSHDGTQIAFTSTEFGAAQEVMKMAASGASRVRLTTSPSSSDFSGAWNNDSTKISFVSTRDSAGGFYQTEIYNMNADGSSQTRLTTTAQGTINLGPAYSPDGTKIAFSSDRDGNYEIYVMDANGSNQTRLTTSEGSDLPLITYSSGHDGDQYSDIDRGPQWSPDGKKLVFRSSRDGTNEIYVVDADGSSSPVRVTNDTKGNHNPSFSPDGNTIVYDQLEAAPFRIVTIQRGSTLTLDDPVKFKPGETVRIALNDDVDGFYESTISSVNHSARTLILHRQFNGTINEAARVERKIGADVSMPVFNAAGASAGAIDWGWRGVILSTHSEITFDMVCRAERTLIDGSGNVLASNQWLRFTDV